jgi:hypothetical protein
MLALTHDSESRLLERANGVQVVDAGNLGQRLEDYIDFANIYPAQFLVDDGEILADRILDVLQGLRFSCPL